jgi:hypothetical protein
MLELPGPERQGPLQGEVVFDDAPKPQQGALALLEILSFLMDRAFEVPGTKVRFGLNSILLMVPLAGDLIASLVSLGILSIGLTLVPVPRIVAVRMLLNSLLDASISWIPIVGNAWDVWFKADTRNVRLFQQYAGWGGQEPPPTWQHWLFVGGLLLALLTVLVLIGLGSAMLFLWLAGKL